MTDQILDNLINFSQNQAKNQFSAPEIVDSILALISDREASILRQRYGLNNQKTRTLEAIGQSLNLTRERVRQIENQAVKNILKNKRYEEIVAPFQRLIFSLVAEHGGLMSEDCLISKLKEMSIGQPDVVPFLKFLLANFVTGLERLEQGNFKPGWRSLDLTLEWVQNILNTFEKILNEKNQIMAHSELMDAFKQSEFYQSEQNHWQELLAANNRNLEQVINSYLLASPKFAQTPFNQWGLTSWGSASPRRINGKIYLLMLHKKQPMHFTEIADLINKHWSDERQVKTATVHNELIFDPRFVLIGRGLYGLKDWGYQEGNVADIVIEVLKNSTTPLSEAEIIKQVKDKKQVKEATIRLVLKNKDKFEKSADNTYHLKAS
ncbi:MAG TPA: sigma factor-like helix-turn-helix DNA-binding protein [bacterium]|nr:sigma factor-like helix-turn-helix DNA-binding protein [bacterium]HPL95199.1 sigma factor-like helix-turn-helix DNA-binding protein [bacterium]